MGFHHFWRDPHFIFIVQGSTLLGRLGKRQQEIGQSRTWKESAPCVAAFSSLCISPCGFILGFRGVLEEVKGSASSEVISCSRGSWGATLCFLGAKWELQATQSSRRSTCLPMEVPTELHGLRGSLKTAYTIFVSAASLMCLFEIASKRFPSICSGYSHLQLAVDGVSLEVNQPHATNPW